MPIDPKTKFRVPSGIPGYWTRQHEMYFIDKDAPEKLRFRLEKQMARLFTLDKSDESSVTYLADCSLVVSLKRDLVIRLVNVTTDGFVYCMSLDAKGEKNWYDEQEFLKEVDPVFAFWTRMLRKVEAPGGDPNKAAIERARQTALLADEAREPSPEDLQAIAALQKQILGAIQRGGRFLSSNKEGNTSFHYSAGKYKRVDEGDYPDMVVFADETAFLKAVRQFFDWNAKRDTYPHSPPEVDVWNFIFNQIYR